MNNREPYLAELRSHRGNLLGQPEHTVQSYNAVAKAGVAMIELDLHLTSDGVPVCIHDATVDRTTNGTGTVVGKTLAQIKALDAGVDFGPSYAGQQVPTLVEALLAIKPYRVRVMIEPKVAGTENAMLNAIQQAGFPLERVTLLAGLFFPSVSAATMRPYFPTVSIYWIATGPPSAFGEAGLTTFKNQGYDGISYWPPAGGAVWGPEETALMQRVGLGYARYGLAGGASEIFGSGANVYLTDDPTTAVSTVATANFTAFKAAYAITVGSDGLYNDPDGDGFTNFEEMIYGGNPMSSRRLPATGPSVQIVEAGGVRTAYLTAVPAATRMFVTWYFAPQWSDDGITWTDVPSTSFTSLNNGYPRDLSHRFVVDMGPVLPTNTKRVRLYPKLFPMP
jgi:glycerophosphoryl diester phosphodiesterase